MPIVSDTSPLILLAKIGRLDVLRRLFADVLIPAAVSRELEAGNPRRPEAKAIAQAVWIRTYAGHHDDVTPPLPARLGPGEAAAIRLALRLSPQPLVLLDDLEGRRTAANLGLRVTGTGGVIVLAKQAGFILEVRSALLSLQNAGMYLADDVLLALLAAAGESDDRGNAHAAE